MKEKTAIVTGATGAIGKAIARQIAMHKEYEVVLICRDAGRGARAVSEIIQNTGNKNIHYELVDLSSYQSIKDFAGRWRGSLHVLVNNAATTPVNRQETDKGIELQFATNVLGYFWLIQGFLEPLKNSAPSRIVNVASYYAGNLDLNDLEFKKRRYDNNSAYRQSKQANRMLTVAFAERLQQYNISVNACHPGDVNSRLSNDLGFGGSDSPDQGAATPVWLATDPALDGITGKYFAHKREDECRFSRDKRAIEQLYNICLSYLD